MHLIRTRTTLLIPLPTLIHDAVEFLKASLNVVVAEERAIDGPEDLTGETRAQIGLYAHPTQDGRTFDHQPGYRTPAYPAEDMPIREKADDHREAVAKRIYAIRNRIVHTKGASGYQEPLFPFDPETTYLGHDIDLVEFLAQKVLIASSQPLRV
jgi:hypothetical protein